MHSIQLLTALLLPVLPALAYEIGGYNYCEGPFALCAGAKCQAISGNSSSVTCNCPIYNGLNAGGSSCAERVDRLISTYSIINLFPTSSQPPLYSFPCSGSNAGEFGQCYDSPCTDNGDGTASCTCGIGHGSNHYLGPTCPTSADQTAALCKELRVSSGSTTAPHARRNAGTKTSSAAAGAGTAETLAQFYGTAPPQETCNAPGS